MDWHYWLQAAGWLFIGFNLGVLAMGIMQIAHNADR